MAEQLTAQQRANLFGLSTRQNLQMLAKQTVTSPSTSMQFSLPKARILSNIFVRVKAKINVKHASLTKLAVDKMAPYRVIRRYSLDLNNGFKPYSISGDGLMCLNMLQPNANIVMNSSDYFSCPTEFTASADGTENEFYFTVQLPVALNQRDPVGLVLLQTEQMTTDLLLDIGNPSDMFTKDIAGFTIDLVSLEAMPMLETFSVPANENAVPDFSVLKLCNDRTDTITSEGQQVIKLSTGTIYRKLILFITDENGNPADASWVTSNLELVFNQADCNYSVNAEMLRCKNAFDLGTETPKGVFIFDFANQGFSNYSGTRDYIDTEKLTEFWVRFNTAGKGKVKIVSECLTRLV